MQKKVYIFNGASRAAIYGIGTYIDQLTYCLKKSDVEFEVIYLYGEGTEVSISEEKGYKQITIPKSNFSTSDSFSRYSRNIAYLLKEFIPEDKSKIYIFHLNFMGNEPLVRYLKKMFKCKMVLAAHYTNWGLVLFGDSNRLRKIYNQPVKKLKDPLEKNIVKNIKEDLKAIKKVDRFICVAKHTLDVFQKISYIPIGKTEIINNALEDKYTPVSIDKKNILRKKYLIP